MAKVSAAQILVACVVVYGSYRVIRHQQEKKKALKPKHQEAALVPTVTEMSIISSIDDVLDDEDLEVSSSADLSREVVSRLWGAPNPAGEKAVQSTIGRYIRWPDQPDTPPYREACVRIRAKAERVLDQTLREGEFPSVEELQLILASEVFPERQWPPTDGDPAWCHEVWRRCEIRAVSRQAANG